MVYRVSVHPFAIRTKTNVFCPELALLKDPNVGVFVSVRMRFIRDTNSSSSFFQPNRKDSMAWQCFTVFHM